MDSKQKAMKEYLKPVIQRILEETKNSSPGEMPKHQVHIWGQEYYLARYVRSGCRMAYEFYIQITTSFQDGGQDLNQQAESAKTSFKRWIEEQNKAGNLPAGEGFLKVRRIHVMEQEMAAPVLDWEGKSVCYTLACQVLYEE